MKRALVGAVAVAALLVSRSSSATLEAEGDVGFGQRSLYGVPIELVALRATLEGRTPHVAGGARFGFEAGQTLQGLTVLQGSIGFLVEYVVGRARFGIGGGIGILSIPRATRGDPLSAAFVEGTLRISVDLVHFGPSRLLRLDAPEETRPALFLASELVLNSARVWGPSVLLGVRY